MVDLNTLIEYCDQRLNASHIQDYCVNGLQIECQSSVQTIVSGVTASLDLIERAAQYQADLILVHHGYFWRNEPAPLTGIKGRRIQALFKQNINLAAYHLPLDIHPEIGNNRLWGEKMGLHAIQATDDPLLWCGQTDLNLIQLLQRIERISGQKPLHIAAGPDKPERIFWSTGAAHALLEKAAQKGAQLFITGEGSEANYHLALEYGIHFIIAGHHATERYGVQALAQELAQYFALEHHYIELNNPI